MSTKTFDHLILIGRPACGKSEFIDFMKKNPDENRAEFFHMGSITEMDDFVWLWEKYEEDNIWERMGRPRLYSEKSEHAFLVRGEDTLDFMINKFNYEIETKYLGKEDFYKNSTIFIEFSRGYEEDGGYRRALGELSREVLEKAAILYVDVTYEESRRRNEARYQEKLKHSVLAHKTPEKDFVRWSKTTDWHELTDEKEVGRLTLNGVEVPYVTMSNMPELPAGPEIGKRYKDALDKLFELYGK